MHPSGIEFGLARGLLQLRGADAVLSDRLFQAISNIARTRLRGRNRLSAIDLWHNVIHEGLGELIPQFTAPHSQTVPFFMGFDRVAQITLMPIAEGAALGRRIDKDFLISRSFIDEFGVRERRLEFSVDVTQARRLLFRTCCITVNQFCEHHSPASLEYVDLLSLFLFERWSHAGCVELAVILRRPSPWKRTRENHPLFRGRTP